MSSAEKVIRIDKKHIWHPFTQMKDYEQRHHIPIVRGKGMFLEDMNGNTYYDTISSWWTNLLGHSHPRINQVISEQVQQLEHVIFAGFTHPYATEMIEKLVHFLPEKLSRYFFSDNGSTAVEVAIKMAFQYFQNQGMTGKTRFVMLENAYHGDTLGAVSVGGIDVYHQLYKPLMFESFKVSGLNCSTCPFRKSEYTFDARSTGCRVECFDQMEEVIVKHHREIAAVVVEPLLQGAAGMLVYPAQYLQKLREITAKYHILLIFDEVATGFGRTGTRFALEQAGVVPDIICLSKTLTAGYMPLALTVATDEIFNAFYDDYLAGKTFFHGHSYTGNPLACRIASETLSILEEENLPYSRQEQMEHFHGHLQDFAQYDFIGDIRFLGFTGALDVVKSRENKESFSPETRIGFSIYEESLKHGIILRPLGDTIYFMLPLIVEKQDLDEIFERTHNVLQKVVVPLLK
ncbi:MAG: adenosylmethionine--8-amino-7-oxononanoate transaminase [Calditrichia bacterium]